MNKIRTLAVLSALVLVVGATTVTAFAGTNFASPAEILASLTGKSLETVTTERAQLNMTYGALADKAGVAENFRYRMMEMKKAQIENKVASGNMAQGDADKIMAKLEERAQNCSGPALQGDAQRLGLGFGNKAGLRNGNLMENGEEGQLNKYEKSANDNSYRNGSGNGAGNRSQQ